MNAAENSKWVAEKENSNFLTYYINIDSLVVLGYGSREQSFSSKHSFLWNATKINVATVWKNKTQKHSLHDAFLDSWN